MPEEESHEVRRGDFREFVGKENQTPAHQSRYIHDIRRRLSEDREAELQQHRTGRNTQKPDRRDTHDSMGHQDPYRQHRAVGDMRSYGERRGGSWADEERDLDTWMRQQGKQRGSVRQQSAMYRSNREESVSDSRSISAPIFGLAGLGERDDRDHRRKKQLQYAAELKEQIREKEEAQRRERDGMDRSNRPRHRDNLPDYVRRRGTDRDRGEMLEDPMPRHSYYQRNETYHHLDDRDMRPSHGLRARDREYPPDPPQFRRPPERDYYPSYDPYYYPPQYPPYHHYPPPPPHAHRYYPPPTDRYHYADNPYLPPRRREWSKDDGRGQSPPRTHRREGRMLDRYEESDDRHYKRSSHSPQGSSGKSDKTSYQQELQRQVIEKRERDEREKREKERYFSKLEEEAKNYNPWGKPGAGAPLRDEKGNIVAARGLRKSTDGTSPRFTQLTEEELKKITQEKHAQDLSQQVRYHNCHLCLLVIHVHVKVISIMHS